MERQVIIEGSVTKVAREESEAYFHSRPLPSQLAAWASQQSSIIASRGVLEDSLKTLEKKYAGQTVPLPPQWGGFRAWRPKPWSSGRDAAAVCTTACAIGATRMAGSRSGCRRKFRRQGTVSCRAMTIYLIRHAHAVAAERRSHPSAQRSRPR